jgi:hypothetical protein
MSYFPMDIDYPAPSAPAFEDVHKRKADTEVDIDVVKKAMRWECTICHDGPEQNDTVMQLQPCRHCFHTRCYTTWLMISPTCPVCRARFTGRFWLE